MRPSRHNQRHRSWQCGLRLTTQIVVAAALAQACNSAGQGTAAQSSDRDRLVNRIDSLVDAYRVAHNAPGTSVGVVRGSDTLVLKGFGLANVEDSVPATASTVYRIGSITKQFTAAGILRLVEQGKVQLDAPVSTYLPHFPRADGRVTIRQLLTHTSGLPNYTELPEFADLRRTDLADGQLVAFFGGRPLDFPPGTRWHYSNSGYYTLGLVLQQLGGVPYAVYLDQTILKPMGLEHTLYCSVEPLIPHRASGYSVTSNEIVNASYLSMHLPGAAGALCSTVGDLLHWQLALVGGRAVRPETYREMTTPATLRDGTHPTYGFALGVYALHGHAAVEHSGGINGFSADLAYYPADSLSVVVLMNSDGGDASLLARRIAELVMHTPDEGGLDLAVDGSSAQRYVGTYTAQAGQPRIEQRGSRLVLVEHDEHPLRFQGQDRFVTADDHDTQLRFTVVDGRASALTITDPDGTPHEFARAAANHAGSSTGP